MEFVFYDKSHTEADLISTILKEENISYKMNKKVLKTVVCDEEEDEDLIFYEDSYEVRCYTDLAHFEYIKHLAYKQLSDRVKLERIYLKKTKGKKKHVQRVSKKGVVDTDNSNKG